MDLNVADTLVECVLELKGGVHCGGAGSGVPGHTQRRRRRRVRWEIRQGLDLAGGGIRPRLHSSYRGHRSRHVHTIHRRSSRTTQPATTA